MAAMHPAGHLLSSPLHSSPPGASRRCSGFSRVSVLLFASMAIAVILTLGVVASRYPSGRSLLAYLGRPAPPPNLVVIIVDSLRADRLGSYGFAEDTAPELDALAGRGVRFARTLAPSSWCRPSIAAMLTSHHPRTLGIFDERGHKLPNRFDTLAEILGDAGYSTIGATANPNINSRFGLAQGFDDYTDSPVRYSWMADADAESISQPTPRARQVFDLLLEKAESAGRPPFHLMADVMEVHDAFEPDTDLSGLDHLFPDERLRPYLQSIRLVSREIDRFVERLTALPGWEETLVVVVSDHGQGLDSHPSVPRSLYHGMHLYESQVRVPLLIYSSSGLLPRGLVVEEPVRLLDLMPTVLDLLGLEAPVGLAGTSLTSLIEGTGRPAQLPAGIIVETRFRGLENLGIYLDDWKYIEHRRELPGVEPRELQKKGAWENGARTNRFLEQRTLADNLAILLRRWEEAHASAEPTLADGAVIESPTVEDPAVE